MLVAASSLLPSVAASHHGSPVTSEACGTHWMPGVPHDRYEVWVAETVRWLKDPRTVEFFSCAAAEPARNVVAAAEGPPAGLESVPLAGDAVEGAPPLAEAVVAWTGRDCLLETGSYGPAKKILPCVYNGDPDEPICADCEPQTPSGPPDVGPPPTPDAPPTPDVGPAPESPSVSAPEGPTTPSLGPLPSPALVIPWVAVPPIPDVPPFLRIPRTAVGEALPSVAASVEPLRSVVAPESSAPDVPPSSGARPRVGSGSAADDVEASGRGTPVLGLSARLPVSVASSPRLAPTVLFALGAAAVALLGAALYHRIRRDEALDQPTRRAVFEAIRREPGIRVAAIARQLGANHNTVLRHVLLLCRSGLVVRRGASANRLFETGSGVDPAIVEATTGEVARRILGHLATGGPCEFRRLAGALGIPKSSASVAVSRLAGAGLLVKRREGPRLIVAANRPPPSS
ncbi:MAG: helix-turn-helix domain-containing protein [Methanobacteriota archaeon]